jgi:hypothetical protein
MGDLGNTCAQNGAASEEPINLPKVVRHIPGSLGVILDDGLRKQIRDAIDRDGERSVLETLEISRMTLARAIAGLPVQRMTASCLKDRVHRLT